MREEAVQLLGAARNMMRDGTHFKDQHGKPVWVVPDYAITALEKIVRGTPRKDVDIILIDHLAERIFDIGMFAELTSPDRYLAGFLKIAKLAQEIQEALKPQAAGSAKPKQENGPQ